MTINARAVGYEKAAFTIDEFCTRNSISRRTFYNLLDEGIGPRVMQLSGGRRISAAAEADWQRDRENEIVAAAASPPELPGARLTRRS